jgi:hypothetical protein
MKRGNYDVLLLRPQDIADVVDMSKAIDLVERLSRGAGFPAPAKNRSIMTTFHANHSGTARRLTQLQC